MHLLIIDPSFGAAGDMILGSLLSLGADTAAVLKAVSTVSKPVISSVERCGISAVYIKTETEKTTRTIDEVFKIIESADAPENAKKLAKRVFSRIQKAESAVHENEHVHFHEVGADDAIADVLGSCTAFLSLGIDKIFIRPLALGSGTIKCSHGIMNVPVPAVKKILESSTLKVSFDSFDGELCTPTGAALLSEFAESFGCSENTGRLIKTGVGAGTRNPTDHPNILCTYVVDSDSESYVDVLETNVDDVSGEVLENTISKMLTDGARDASLVPILMKKGRAGYLIRVVCLPKDSVRFAKILARETGSLGIRCTPMVHRFVADRNISTETVVINDRVYTADVKSALIDGSVYSKKAEFEDCKKIAEASSVPVKDIKRIIEEEAWKRS
ncbi:MAG: nickel pincer cofactor biosynthesis protein LarC [Methanocorpusculum sp.]|nr:nickel pincer cofactor biosynthesis protein LarC [Methanocorpusculum sp.]